MTPRIAFDNHNVDMIAKPWVKVGVRIGLANQLIVTAFTLERCVVFSKELSLELPDQHCQVCHEVARTTTADRWEVDPVTKSKTPPPRLKRPIVVYHSSSACKGQVAMNRTGIPPRLEGFVHANTAMVRIC